MAQPRRGVVRYVENPFLAGTTYETRKKRVRVAGGKAVVDVETGEVENVAEIVQVTKVDSEEFVKIYTRHLKVIFDLSPSSQKLFQVILAQVQQIPNEDKIMLNLGIATDYFTKTDQAPISKATFHRSIKELIDKQFIAESVLYGLYFINPNLFFNGDRVRFVQEIRRTGVEKDYKDKLKALEERRKAIPGHAEPEEVG